MAARSVFKLITKTCSYTLNPTCPSTFSSDKCYRKGQRSYSQPPKHQFRRKTKQDFYQLRQLSKSLQNLRDSRFKEDEFEEFEAEEKPRFSVTPVDTSFRETAKEFKEKYVPEEKNDEGNPIYELGECSRSEENYYQVFHHFKKSEDNKMKRLFMHLQPCNLRPYGSNDNLFYPNFSKKKIKIVYPSAPRTGESEPSRRKFDGIHYKEFSSYRLEKKESTGHEDGKKLSLGEKSSSKMIINKKNYSTSCMKPRKTLTKSGVDLKGPKLTVCKSLTRRSSTALVKKHKKETKKSQLDAIVKSNIATLEQLTKKINESRTKRLNREQSNTCGWSRSYNTYNKPADINCDDYVTVKLSELKEECRKLKKCKPKKISFGRLPKLTSPDCPCIEDVPLKEGKPLIRLKKRFDVKEPKNVCESELVCTTPRADDNYKVVPKTLPVIQPQECPCEEREMTDFVIKRLPKKHIPEPKRICSSCDDEICCAPRADASYKHKVKPLPKLKPNNCPCIEEIPLKNVPLHRLKAKPIKEPERKCSELHVCEIPRADDGLKVEQKVLPTIKSECVCVEPPPLEPGTPLPRLPKFKYVEKPRESCDLPPCYDAVRADGDLKVTAKKLPVFVPQNCPCKEEVIPDAPVKMKRLKMRNIPKEKKKVCVEEVCGERADDGMKIKPKQLPVLEPKECPCVPTEMKDAPPLKKLVPKPVQERPRPCLVVTECTTPRADEKLKVQKKSLPVLPPGACPCIEPEPPLDVKPLKKLKKKPVVFKRVCTVVEECTTERADENLKVKVKKLPKLDVPDCPCIEPSPPEDVKPLARLKKVHIPEPKRICPVVDSCEEATRADEDDWLYWKRVEVKPPECEPKKTNKRSFSTVARRFYCTSTKNNDLFQLKYDVPQLSVSEFGAKPYNVIIDIKPSAPLILTQQPLKSHQVEGFDTSLARKRSKRSRSEPVDCVTFVIYKSNSLGASKSVKEPSSDVVLFSNNSRFISTCSTLYEYSERKDKLKDHVTPSCECPPNDRHLQPRNPIIPEKETFITQYPADELVDHAAKKSRMYYKTRKADVDSHERKEEAEDECKEEEQERAKAICEVGKDGTTKVEKQLTLWEKIVNYFKARPCPSPEEFRKMRLREDAERAASKAGLCLYDPKEMLRKNEKELPKVITASSARDDCQK
ncbi:uncharacterized protein LOC103315087 [Tribolium castaneum]|uniref:Titin-like n=1 Tax=Tribolium castaneum TaxID=7070 RepID=D7EJS3_TRICA|nr:PREDICTED: uncharacterized protein LOC103315087 [Tribolium castaneum]EFA12843.2 hypothetical protein TcasGA2_TC010260 [Tribolium castaneum]|eukprot:XP_008201124.1 PREDICTED: uncharacterized protein LOC103315087 [Tribolium castaneum]